MTESPAATLDAPVADAQPARVELRGISKRFGKFEALKGVLLVVASASVAPRAPSAMEVCAARSCVRATDADGCVG